MKSLVVGLGIGELYKTVLSELGSTVLTVDANPEKSADFLSVDDALTCEYDLAYIGTPNFTHEELARKVAPYSKIVLIEKPGVGNSERWQQLINDFPNTRFVMVKNNQYRDEIAEFKELTSRSKNVIVSWCRENCVPHPGSWFTDKEKAFGGVSRDLMPHMLSYYTVLTDFETGKTVNSNSIQRHTLDSITSTDYGTINREGVYDVDDYCEIVVDNNAQWLFYANWKTDHIDESYIAFDTNDGITRFDLGWCPESAYKKMINTLTLNLNNDEFWVNQNKQDIWIHQQIENL